MFCDVIDKTPLIVNTRDMRKISREKRKCDAVRMKGDTGVEHLWTVDKETMNEKRQEIKRNLKRENKKSVQNIENWRGTEIWTEEERTPERKRMGEMNEKENNERIERRTKG